MKVLIFVSPSNFKDDQLKMARLFLDKWGIGYDVASYTSSEAKGSQGHVQRININMSSAIPSNYNGIIIIGGHGIENYKLYEYRPLLDTLMVFNRNRKLVCGIGSGIRPIVRANIVRDRRVAHNGDKALVDSIRLFHGIPSEKGVESDGGIITVSDREASHIEEGMQLFVETITSK